MRLSLPFILNRNWFRDLTEVEKYFLDKDGLDISKDNLIYFVTVYFTFSHDTFFG